MSARQVTVFLVAALVYAIQARGAGVILDYSARGGLSADASNNVTQWADNSSGGVNAIVLPGGYTGPQWTTALVNGNAQPVLRFDGTNDVLTAPIHVPTSGSIFVVFRNSDPAIGSDRRLVGWDRGDGTNGLSIIPVGWSDADLPCLVVLRNGGGTTGNDIKSPNMTTDQFEVWGVSWGDTYKRTLIRHTASSENTYTVTSAGSVGDPGLDLRIGWGAQNVDQKFKGDLGAFVVYDTEFDAQTLGGMVDALYKSWFTPVPGDTNGDGVIDVLDLNNVFNHLGEGGPGLLGDTNYDQVIDVLDLNNVFNNLGTVGAAGGAIPEPATLSLLALGALAMLKRRR